MAKESVSEEHEGNDEESNKVDAAAAEEDNNVTATGAVEESEDLNDNTNNDEEVEETQEEDENNGEEDEEKDKEGASDNPYERMVRSLTNRASNKRKVKLMENQLAHFVFAESDSEDDEDYTVGDEELPSDDDDDDDGKEDDGGGESEGSSDDGGGGKSLNLLDLLRSYEARGAKGKGKGSDSEAEENEQQQEEVEQDEDMDYDDEKGDSQEQDTEEEATALTGGVKRNDILRSNRQYKKNVLVCGVCLESDENEGDEIVECDNCGITVHEGCYGDFDLDYDNKSVSDDLTEPWFCEPCKSGVSDNLICELCPTKGGVFKESDTGRWVHLICALYTPYVGFRDVVKLQVVVLEDIKREMWGKKECAFCCDENFSRTGVCIGCDAGLCKTTFHVTCGQRNGFLSDIPDKTDKNDEMSDFLFAHCKLHTMKIKLKKRKTSWMAFQARVSKFKYSEDAEEKARIATALEYARHEYKTFRRNLIPAKQLPQEFPRFLSSCPEASMMLSRKADLLEMDVEPSYSINAAVISGRILKHEPNLSEDFVNYFFKREMQMKELQLSIDQGEPTKAKLQNQQKVLMKKSESYHSKLEEVQLLKASLTQSLQDLHDLLCKFAGKSLKPPGILKSKHTDLMNDKIEQSAQLLNSIVHRCDTCKSTDNQHLLAHCGTCSRYYHMDCVDPPLSRLPRKSDKYVWQCTLCDPSDKSESDTEGPICVLVKDENGVLRRKRPNKEPDKYNPENPKDKKEKKDNPENPKDKKEKKENPENPKDKKEKKDKENKDKDNKDKDKDNESNNKSNKENERKRPYKRRILTEEDPAVKKRKHLKKDVEKPEHEHPERERPDRERGKDKEKKESTGNESTEKDKEPPPKKKKPAEAKVSDCFVCKTMGDPKSLVKCDECGKCYHFLTCINPPYPRNPKVSKYWSWICEECDNTDEQAAAIEPADEKRVSTKTIPIKSEDTKASSNKTPTLERQARRSIKKDPDDNSVSVKSPVTMACSIKITPSKDVLTHEKKEAKTKKEPTHKSDTCSDNKSSDANNKISQSDNAVLDKQSLDSSKLKASVTVSDKATSNFNSGKQDDDKLFRNADKQVGIDNDSKTQVQHTNNNKPDSNKQVVSDISKPDVSVMTSVSDGVSQCMKEDITPDNSQIKVSKLSCDGASSVAKEVASDISAKLEVSKITSEEVSSTKVPSENTESQSSMATVNKTSSGTDKHICAVEIMSDEISSTTEKQVSSNEGSKQHVSGSTCDKTPKITDKEIRPDNASNPPDSKPNSDKTSSNTEKQVKPDTKLEAHISNTTADTEVHSKNSSKLPELKISSNDKSLNSEKHVSSDDKSQLPEASIDKISVNLAHSSKDTKVCTDGNSKSQTSKVNNDAHIKDASEDVTRDINAGKEIGPDDSSKAKDSKVANAKVSTETGEKVLSIQDSNIKDPVSGSDEASTKCPERSSDEVSMNAEKVVPDVNSGGEILKVSSDEHSATKDSEAGSSKKSVKAEEKVIPDDNSKKMDSKSSNDKESINIKEKVIPDDNSKVSSNKGSAKTELKVPDNNSKGKDSKGSNDKESVNIKEKVILDGNSKTMDSKSSNDKESVSIKEKVIPDDNSKVSSNKGSVNTELKVPDNNSKGKDSKSSNNRETVNIKEKVIPNDNSKVSSNKGSVNTEVKVPSNNSKGKDSKTSNDKESVKTKEKAIADNSKLSSDKVSVSNEEKVPSDNNSKEKDTKASSDKEPINTEDKGNSIDNSKANERSEKNEETDKEVSRVESSKVKDSKSGGEQTSTITKVQTHKDDSKSKDYKTSSDRSSTDKQSRHGDYSKSETSKMRSDKLQSPNKDKHYRHHDHFKPEYSKIRFDKSSPNKDKYSPNKDKQYRHYDHFKSDKMRGEKSSPNKDKQYRRYDYNLDVPRERSEKSSPSKDKHVHSSDNKTYTEKKHKNNEDKGKDDSYMDMEVFGEDY